MKLSVEDCIGKSGVYFITDANFTHVRIGESSNVGGRIIDHISSRGKSNTIILCVLVCDNHLEEERKAHNYFMKYRIPTETDSFYSSDIIEMIEEYVEKSGSRILKNKKLVNEIAKTYVSTISGEIRNINETRPRCFFYPDQVAQTMGKAGPDEVYRTYPYGNKRVFVSNKFHKQYLILKNSFNKQKKSGNNIKEFIDEPETNNLNMFLK